METTDLKLMIKNATQLNWQANEKSDDGADLEIGWP